MAEREITLEEIKMLDDLFARAEEEAKDKYEYYKKLSELE